MSDTAELRLFEVFIRSKRGIDHQHVGSVYAGDHEHALANARDVYIRRGEGVSIWVVATDDIVASQESDVETFYDPMDDKAYRHAMSYPMPNGVKNI